MQPAKTLVAVCALAIAVGACGGGNEGGDDSVDYRDAATYTEALDSDPGNLHPLRAVQQTTFNVIPFAYDSLINVDRKGRVVGQLAERWEAAPRKVTYTLRPGITCADGTELTASHVADNFRWAKDPKNKSTVIGEGLPSPDFEVEADDAARTVTLRLTQPYGFLLQGAGLVPIVCPEGLADPDRLAHGTDGTGPFELTDYVADDHLTFTAREGYRWGPDGATADEPGFPAKVVFKIVKDETTMANLLLSGGLTSATVLGPDRERLEGRGFHEVPDLDGPSNFFFNQRRDHPGADPDVRKALTMALDLDQLMKVVTQGLGERPTQLSIISPRPCPGDNVTGTLPGHDPDAAKALLEQAGWTAGTGGTRAKDGRPLTLTLIYESGDVGTGAGMELAAEAWKQLGVDVKLRGKDANAYVQDLFGGGEWDAAWLDVGLPFPHMFRPFAVGPPSPEGQNFAAIENPDYARLSEQALQTPGAAGCELWGRAEQALFGSADVVPAAAVVTITFARAARLAIGVNGTEPTSIRMLED